MISNSWKLLQIIIGGILTLFMGIVSIDSIVRNFKDIVTHTASLNATGIIYYLSMIGVQIGLVIVFFIVTKQAIKKYKQQVAES